MVLGGHEVEQAEDGRLTFIFIVIKLDGDAGNCRDEQGERVSDECIADDEDEEEDEDEDEETVELVENEETEGEAACTRSSPYMQ